MVKLRCLLKYKGPVCGAFHIRLMLIKTLILNDGTNNVGVGRNMGITQTPLSWYVFSPNFSLGFIRKCSNSIWNSGFIGYLKTVYISVHCLCSQWYNLFLIFLNSHKAKDIPESIVFHLLKPQRCLGDKLLSVKLSKRNLCWPLSPRAINGFRSRSPTRW